jgi:hypothetical protein
MLVLMVAGILIGDFTMMQFYHACWWSKRLAISHQCQKLQFCLSYSRHQFVIALALIPTLPRSGESAGLPADFANEKSRICLGIDSEQV